MGNLEILPPASAIIKPTGHLRPSSRVQALTAAFEQQLSNDDTDMPPVVMDLKSSSSCSTAFNNIAANSGTYSIHPAAAAQPSHVEQVTSPKAAPSFLNKLRIFGART
jgi:hypothetical protein